jgi:hypothetical protein
VSISSYQLCAYAIMKMIEKVSKKTFVKNVERIKLQPNKQLTSITPVAPKASRTQIPPLDAPSTS